MKKMFISLILYTANYGIQAQVRTVNSATNVPVTNSPAFIDASSNTTVNGSSNVGKGLIFPRVDLSTMTAFPAVTTGIPNAFPTRFDGMVVYNTATTGSAGVGSTSGTLSSGFWYYENKSSSNTGGTWKPVSSAFGDNLGNHIATQHLALNDYELRLRGGSDNNQSLVYNSTINGPRLFGASGGYLGTSNGTNALTWDNNGNISSPGKITAGTGGGYVSLLPGNVSATGHIGFFKANNTRLGYIGYDNTDITYIAENGASHKFSGEIYSGVNQSIRFRGTSGNGIIWDNYGGGWYMSDTSWMRVSNNKSIYTEGEGRFGSTIRSGLIGGYVSLNGGNSTNSGNISFYKSDASTRLGYIGFDNSNIGYTAEVGYHIFNTKIQAGNGIGNVVLAPSDATHTGHILFNRSDNTRTGYIGYDYNNISYVAETGSHVFNTTIITPRVQGPSDRRFKKDIEPIMNASEKLNLLNGYTYTWRNKKEFPGQTLGEGKDMGVIAQEIEKVFPEAVMTNNEGYKSVNYNALIPVLIEALKESNQKIKALEDRLNAMQPQTDATARHYKAASGSAKNKDASKKKTTD